MKNIATGERFGFLTVLANAGHNDKGKRLWECQCDCGEIRLVTTGHLGREVTHCGCKKTLPRKDLTGQSFHDWIVLHYVGASRYLCRCRCGKEKEVCNRELQNGESKSCGCREKPSLIKNFTGIVFGRLTVLDLVKINKFRNTVWRCQCVCGNIVEISSGELTTTKRPTISCGCAQRDSLKARTPEEKYISYLKGAKTANILTVKQHWKTNQELICRGSWEPVVLDYLNNNRIEFDWQIPHTLPDGSLYIVDLYLIASAVWVEIKGFPRTAWLNKWNQFKQLHPNCTVWDKDKLVSLGIILPKRRRTNDAILAYSKLADDDIFSCSKR